MVQSDIYIQQKSDQRIASLGLAAWYPFRLSTSQSTMLSKLGALIGHGGPELCLQPLRPRQLLARTRCAAARRSAFPQGVRDVEAQACGCRHSCYPADATPARACRRRTRTSVSATAAAVEHSVAATSLTEAALALETWMASNGGRLPAQGARPSDVPTDVGGTALGFVCTRDVQAGEVRVETENCAAFAPADSGSGVAKAAFERQPVQHLSGGRCGRGCNVCCRSSSAMWCAAAIHPSEAPSQRRCRASIGAQSVQPAHVLLWPR